MKGNLECADVMDEITLNLCHGCTMTEDDTYRDDEWETKYIHMNRVKKH